MKKISNEPRKINGIWFNWLTRKFTSYEAFKYFDLGEDPKDVAEHFISLNKNEISEILAKFDEGDKDTLDQFQKLTECEWHIFRLLKSQLKRKNKLIIVDFKQQK